jgi:hypothetical protein
MQAAIVAMTGRDPKSVEVMRTEGEVIFLSYVRPSDGTRWNNRCKLQGDRVIWASEPSRWRTDPRDEAIYFESGAGGRELKIIQRFADGSSSVETYSALQLQ